MVFGQTPERSVEGTADPADDPAVLLLPPQAVTAMTDAASAPSSRYWFRRRARSNTEGPGLSRGGCGPSGVHGARDDTHTVDSRQASLRAWLSRCPVVAIACVTRGIDRQLRDRPTSLERLCTAGAHARKHVQVAIEMHARGDRVRDGGVVPGVDVGVDDRHELDEVHCLER